MPKRDESIEIAQRVKAELENEPKKVAQKLWSAVPQGMEKLTEAEYLDTWRRHAVEGQFHVDMIKRVGPKHYFKTLSDAFPQFKGLIKAIADGNLDPKEIAPLRLPFMPAPPPPPPIVPEMAPPMGQQPMPVPGGEMVEQPIEPMIQPPMEVGNGL